MAKPRIVIADDHDKTRAAIANLLASDFDVVAVVADGQAAVDAAEGLNPDLIVLDISMPGVNGFEAAALIRQLPDPPWIVFATAYEDVSIVSAAAALGASAVVLKRKMQSELVPAILRAMLFHAVCFYEDASSLARTVASFIGEGLAVNEGAVIITTASRSASIREQLAATGVPSEGRLGQVELLMLDADEVLSQLIISDRPDAERFDDMIHPIIDRAAGSRTRPV